MPIHCARAAPFLLTIARGGPPPNAEVQAHVSGCASCQRQLERERALDGALKLLPRAALPESLARRLPGAAPRAGRLRWEQAAVMIAAAACVGLFVVARTSAPRSSASDRLIEETVNDHLRQLYRDKPVEVASSDHHQVKPWFSGRVDFAPVIRFEGDDEFPLVGGSVGYFLDRKAAVLSYARRLHSISLLIFPAVALDWPNGPDATASRGFNVLRWRQGDLAYALVSDVNAAELRALAARVRGQP